MLSSVALAGAAALIGVPDAVWARDGKVAPPAPAARAAREVTLKAPGSRFVLIRGGLFRMGSTALEIAAADSLCQLEPYKAECDAREMFGHEHAVHQVMLSDYWLQRTEVTNGEYRRCVAVGRCKAPHNAAARAWTARADHPATLVSWYDARDYCAFIGARLPTEAEWERAARGWARRTYPWGNVFDPRRANHGRFGPDVLQKRDGYAELAPVGALPAGRTPEGVEDMAGNAAEWVADWYAPGYPAADEVNPKGPQQGAVRVVRGGSYRAGRAWLRGASRRYQFPSARRPWVGFRCARSAHTGSWRP